MEGITDQAPRAQEAGPTGRFDDRRRLDRLTGLLSRMAFERLVASAEEEARSSEAQVAIVFLDLVDFKAVNVRHGLEVGDEVLRAIGARLRSVVRDRDQVARVGGDEFAVLLSDADVAGLRAAADRIRASFDEPFPGGAATVAVSPRMTVTVGPTGKVPGEDLLWRSIKADVEAATRDIRARLSEAERRSRQDPLTGALNRFGLEEAVGALAPPCAVALVDIDDLKRLNDTTDGYLSGDRALQLVADLLASGRDTDVVGRWGGDEFLLLAPGAGAAGTVSHLHRVLAEVRTTRCDDVEITFSAGVAELVPPEDGGFRAALAAADRAVHAAKRAGRAQIVAAPS